MTSLKRSKKSPDRKSESSPSSRDLTPSEIESLRRDAQESLEEMDRMDAEEIKAGFRTGRLSREEAIRQLQALGFQ